MEQATEVFLDAKFGAFMAALALIVGIMLLTGHGDIFLKGTGSEAREKVYDMEKFSRASGICMILFGVLTGIDCFTTSPALKIGYVAAIALVFGGLVFYIRTRCKK